MGTTNQIQTTRTGITTPHRIIVIPIMETMDTKQRTTPAMRITMAVVTLSTPGQMAGSTI